MFATAPLIQLSQTAAHWAAMGTYVPQLNQVCYETDTRKAKTGDGVTTFSALAYDAPDGSPFTGDGIDALDNDASPPATGLIPFVDVTAEVDATAAGEATDVGTIQVNATGALSLSGNVTAGDVLPAINGVTGLTFSATAQTGLPLIQVGATVDATIQNIVAALNGNHIGRFAPLAAVVLSADLPADDVIITATNGGEAGNAVTIGADAGVFTRSAATLEGGVDAATISIGNKVYSVVATATNTNQIAKGTTVSTYATNIANAVNRDTASTLCTAVPTLGVLAFTANNGLGAAGNDITIETTDTNLTLDAEFAGGISAGNVLKNLAISDLP